MDVTKKSIIIILTAWLSYLLVIFCAQHLGWGFGYHIWPQGEERNWLDMIMSSPSADMVKDFWKLDGRNPLSAWFWYYASPFIVNIKWGVYLLGLVVNLVLSIVVFLLLNQLGKNKFAFFAICVALLTLVWNFSFRFDNSPISSYIAISFTMLSLLFYCKFIDEDRKNSHYILLSLLCYFISFTTYTLQSGALLGIIILGLFRSKNSIKENMINTFFDSACFFSFFYIYSLIWYETTLMPSEVFFSYSLSQVVYAFADSISKFIFPPSLPIFYTYLKQQWSLQKIMVVFSCSFLGFLSAIVLASRKMPRNKDLGAAYFWCAVILLSIALPTAIVEATSHVFRAGDRSYFSQQIFLPILYSAVIFFLANMFFPRFSKSIIISFISIFGAMILTISFYYNHVLLEKTRYQMKLAQAINDLNLPQEKRINFIVKINNKNSIFIGTEPCLKAYSRTVLKNKNSFIRVLSSAPAPRGYENSWKVIFDSEGIKNANEMLNPDLIPYQNTLVVYFDGEALEVPSKIDKSFFDGFQVDWKRKEPFLQKLS